MNPFDEIKRVNLRIVIAILIIGFLLPAVLSMWNSWIYQNRFTQMKGSRLMIAQANMTTSEENLYGAEGEWKEIYESEYNAWKDQVEAYTNDDPLMMADSELRLLTAEEDKAALGEKSEPREFDADMERLALLRYLKERSILPYDPLVPSFDGVSALGAFTSKEIPVFLPLLISSLCVLMVTGEIQSGSIKYRMSFRQNRSAILFQKYCVCIVISVILLLLMLLGTFIGATLFSGTGDFRYPVEAASSFFNTVTDNFVPSYIVLLRVFVLMLGSVVFFTSLSFLLSIAFKSLVAALIVSDLTIVGAVVLCLYLSIKFELVGLRLLPFAAGTYSSAAGVLIIPAAQNVSSPGTVVVQAVANNTELLLPLPGIAGLAITLASGLILWFISAAVFKRKDIC